MTSGDAAHERVERAETRRHQARGLQELLEAATAHGDETTGRVQAARDALDQEDRDVARFESLSWSRIWSGLRGSAAADRDREAAQRDAARYALVDAEARDELAWQEVEAVQQRLDALGDVDEDYREALDAQEQWTLEHDAVTAARLVSLAQRRGGLRAEDEQAREAHAAGMRARALLLRARGLLSSAGTWSAWDTFGGGGLLTDLVTYDRLDDVAALLRSSDVALGRFSRELADLRLEAVDAVSVDGFTRTVDVFFDNLFSDLAVGSRIQDAARRVGRVLAEVERTLNELTERGHDIAAELDELAEERERLLRA